MMRAIEIGCLAMLGGCSVVPNPAYAPDAGTDGGSTTTAVESSSGSSDEDGTAIADAESTLSDGETSSTGSSEDVPTGFACGVDAAPMEGPCPPECDACVGPVCRFDCASEGECRQAMLVCPEGLDCSVTCSGHHACERAAVVCPMGARCETACDGEHACEGIELRCGGGTCALACGEGRDVCRDAIMSCGTNDGSIACAERQRGIVVEPNAASGCACAAEDTCLGPGED